MPRILVVCTGNICRSPLIERVLQGALDQAYGPGAVEVSSAGTMGMVDSPMGERSAAIFNEWGGDPAVDAPQWLRAVARQGVAP